MHILMMLAGGLIGLGVFILAAVFLKYGVAGGARAFIWPWLAVALINMFVGVYWANYPYRVEIPVFALVFAVPAGLAWLIARRFA